MNRGSLPSLPFSPPPAPTLALTLALSFACALAAQSPPPKTEPELDTQLVQTLVGFARQAETMKAPGRARSSYELILAHYDVEHAAARTALGWKKVDGEWQAAVARDKLPKDAATPQQHKQLDEAWRTASKRAAKLHRELAKTLEAGGNRARAVHHFARAIAFDGDDVESHTALGHGEHRGFRGNDEQIAFVKRFHEILAKAREIAELGIEVTPLDAEAMPRELKASGLTFHGARSEFMACWDEKGPETAANWVTWHARGVHLLQYLFGDEAGPVSRLRTKAVSWVAVVRSPASRLQLLTNSPVTRGGDTIDRELLTGGGSFASATGQAEWIINYGHDDDVAVGQAAKRCTPGFNSGLSEGLVHTMTWLLVGTTHASYMQLPPTTGGDERHSPDPRVWLKELREQVRNGTDWELVQVPREQMTNFRNAVRFKSWTFVTWLLARHPDRWVSLLAKLGHEKRMPEDVRAILADQLGAEVETIDAEWREWVRAGSRIGKASGLPQ
jgi:hypothetical protein